MKEIGGYFGLELNSECNDFHSSGIFLNSGKNALEFVLSSIPLIKRLWVPYFTCEVVLEPIKKRGIPYSFYHINKNLELKDDIKLDCDEYLLITNYYGIKDAYVKLLATRYKSQLIVDNAQALYAKPIEGIKTIYSPRKYIGIPDGGIVYIDKPLEINSLERECSYQYCSHLLKRLDIDANFGYKDFHENGLALSNHPVKQISKLSLSIFNSIDFVNIKNIRRKNFILLHNILGKNNKFSIPDTDSFECPLVYPYLTSDKSLKRKLIENKVFVATYWPNVFKWCKENSLEYQLADRLIAIPIDQRYGEKEMKYIIKILNYE